MSQKKPSQVAASVRQRLLNLKTQTGRPFGELLQFYAMERFLYRLSRSSHREKLILKGALMMVVWQSPSSRPTMDIDFLGKLSNDEQATVAVIRDICSTQVEDDGVVFDPSTVVAEFIIEEADYRGLRVRFTGTLTEAQITMQLDIGFGDILIPKPEQIEYPTLLDQPHPILIGYTMESTIAEKLEAMVKLGIANSRMKDFYDIWLLSRQFDFDGAVLSLAIRETFKNRGTAIALPVFVFSPEFSENAQKQQQWKAYVDKNRLQDAPSTIQEALDQIRLFLHPIVIAIATNSSFSLNWKPSQGWIAAS